MVETIMKTPMYLFLEVVNLNQPAGVSYPVWQ